MIQKTPGRVVFMAGVMGFILLAMPLSAQAQDAAPAPAPAASTETEAPARDQDNLYQSVPQYEISKEDFEARTRPFADTPEGYATMAYTMRIPKDWEQVKSREKEKEGPYGDGGDAGAVTSILSEVVRFYGPSLLDSRTYFSMTVLRLPQQISARNWILNYAQQNSYPLQYMTVLSDKKVEILYVLVEGDTSYVVRALFEINGSMATLLTYAVPEPKWMEERPVQDYVLRSFKFNEYQERQVEERRTYAFLDLLRFDYPVSWKLMAPNIYSIEAMDAKIVNAFDEKNIRGEIDVHVVSTELDTTLAEEVQQLQKVFEKRGLVIGKLIDQPSSYKMHENIHFSRIEVYEANNAARTLIDHEYWVGILIEDRYFYIVTMLTPARKIDFYTWATNKEAFETVISSLRP